MGKKLRCYIYTRVSTEMQVDGYSLEAQKERLRSEAEYRGMRVVGEYSDEGKSGKNIKGRPSFQKMLLDIKDGKDKIDYVLVFKLSRFGRNAADTLNSLQYMEDYGVNLLCVEDGIDSAGAAGKLMISVLAAVAEIERENIKEQTMAGRVQKARDGRWNGGFAPYGYRLEYQEGEKSKVLVVEEQEAELVRLIFDKFVNTDMGANGIAKWLNEHGYTKTVRQNGTMPTISAHFVKLVLDNPVYMGKIAYGRRKTEKIDGTRNEFHVVKQAADAYEVYDGIHDAIVSEEMWYQAQAKREITGVKREKTHSLEHAHILSGLVKCPVCGSSMYGVVNRKKKKGSDNEYYTDMWYYRCKHRSGTTGKSCSYKTYVRQDIINAEVMELMKQVLSIDDFKMQVANMVGANGSAALEELEKEKTKLQSERDKAERKKKRLLAKIANLDADDDLYETLCDDFMEIVRELTEKIAKLDADLVRNRLAIENAKKKTYSIEQYYNRLGRLFENIDNLADEDIKSLMDSAIEKVEIYPERQEDGRWVKSIQLKFMLNYKGEETNTVYEIVREEEENDNSLPQETTDETIVLIQKKNS